MQIVLLFWGSLAGPFTKGPALGAVMLNIPFAIGVDMAFELVRIALIATVYSTIIFLLKIIYTKIKPGSLKQIKFRKIYLFAVALLFVFSFTYYGDHGLGDDSYLPLGHGQTMEASDGYAFFSPRGVQQTVSVDSFVIKRNMLCMASGTSYLVYNLDKGELKKFDNKNLYEQYAASRSLPMTNQLKKFEEQYRAYWNGWRFWLLP